MIDLRTDGSKPPDDDWWIKALEEDKRLIEKRNEGINIFYIIIWFFVLFILLAILFQ